MNNEVRLHLEEQDKEIEELKRSLQFAAGRLSTVCFPSLHPEAIYDKYIAYGKENRDET
jgi:hypothetical protein